MDYLCAKFVDFSVSRCGFIVRTDGQTESQTDSQTEADERYTRETTVGVSNQKTECPTPALTYKQHNFM